jgi:hypothetical protein
MNDNDQIQSSLTNGGPGYLEMNDAFCARMRKAIEAGAGKCPDWRDHHTWNEKSQIRLNRPAAD